MKYSQAGFLSTSSSFTLYVFPGYNKLLLLESRICTRDGMRYLLTRRGTFFSILSVFCTKAQSIYPHNIPIHKKKLPSQQLFGLKQKKITQACLLLVGYYMRVIRGE